MSRPASLEIRVTALVGLATTVIFLVSAWGIERSIQSHFTDQDLNELRVIADGLGTILSAPDGTSPREAIADRLSRLMAGHPGAYIVVFHPNGRPLYGFNGIELAERMLQERPAAALERKSLRIWRAGRRTYRGAVIRVAGYKAVVARAIDFHLSYLSELRRALWFGTFFSSVIAIFVAWIAVRRGLLPIHRISARIQSITSDQLDVRLNSRQVPIELAGLVSSFNAMLDRIGEGFRRLSHFSGDIAHELRTPLTNLSTQTQVALSKARTVDEYREILYSNLEEYERLSKMIGDMLFLAKSDHQLLKPNVESVELTTELRALFDYFDAWAEERHVKLAMDGVPGRVAGDRAMLRRALTNLLSNAIRHTPPAGTVAVSVEQEGDSVVVSVENPGQEISPEHLPKLFDRFYRVDLSRQRGSEGVGLGLAIVKSIVDAHGGTISVSSAAGWTRFRLSLPIQTDEFA